MTVRRWDILRNINHCSRRLALYQVFMLTVFKPVAHLLASQMLHLSGRRFHHLHQGSQKKHNDRSKSTNITHFFGRSHLAKLVNSNTECLSDINTRCGTHSIDQCVSHNTQIRSSPKPFEEFKGNSNRTCCMPGSTIHVVYFS